MAAMRASYDNLLPGITSRCLVVWAGFTVLLSPVISLKRRADIQLDMSTSQAENLCVFGRKDDGKVDFSQCCEDKRNCGICDR